MQELWTGVGVIIIYFAIAASVALGSRVCIKIPDELFRKILHFILLGSLFGFVFGFETWWYSVLTAIVFAVIVYPILVGLERMKNFSELITERKKGELKTSLLLVFGMFAVVISICWGWLGDKYLVLASILAWGFGDAAAALVGKKFGKHKISWKHLDGKKSAEGTAAMFLTAFVSVCLILHLRGGMPWWQCVLVALVTALVSASTELYSKGGMDTVICPLASMATLVPLIYLFGGI